MKGYKGFDQNLRCRDKQYEVGKEFTHDGPLSLCQSGLHFCENPLDLFVYYAPADSRYAEVEADEVSDKQDGDSKRVCRKLKVSAEISLHTLVHAGVKFLQRTTEEKIATNTGNQSAATNTGYQSAATNTGYQSAATNTGNYSAATNTGDYSAATNTGDRSAATNTGDRSAATNTGYRSAATNTGDRSAATNTGNYSAATNTGDRSAATNTGEEGCAISLGIEGKAKGAKGCWLTLAEWKQDSNGMWRRMDVQTARVDDEQVKADVFYVLRDGKFVEAKP